MVFRSNDILDRIKPYVPEYLIDHQIVDHAKHILLLLPEIIYAYGFECRLADNETVVDLATCFSASSDAPIILSGDSSRNGMSDFLRSHSSWSKVQDFCKIWSCKTSPLHKLVPFIWLSFDNVNSVPRIPLPCIHFCIDPFFLKEYVRMDTWENYRKRTSLYDESYRNIVEAALRTLFGQPLSPLQREKLFICFYAANKNQIRAVHLSVMLPREPIQLKINLSVPRDNASNFLHQIGWSGRTEEFERILSLLCLNTNFIRLDLAVENDIIPKVGVEFFSAPFEDLGRREEILNIFVELGLCTTQKRGALLSWPGFSWENFPGHPWPVRLSKSWYAKLAYSSNERMKIKAYLGFKPSFVSF